MNQTTTTQFSEMCRLAGRERVMITKDLLRQRLLMLELTGEALDRGGTWAEIGVALLGRPDAKAAKHLLGRMRRWTQEELFRRTQWQPMQQPTSASRSAGD